MAMPSRWCPTCDQIRTPDTCAMCGGPTIASEDLDPEMRRRFGHRLNALAKRGVIAQ